MKNRVIGAAICACITSIIPQTTFASELGGGVYPNGAEGFSSAALPPEGTYLLAYYQHYEADRFNGDTPDELIPNFRVNVDAAVLRLVKVWDQKILGADLASHVILPVVDIAVDAGGTSDNRTGVGDLTVTPVILGWHPTAEIHITAAVDVNVPIGTYDPGRLANIGRNYWNVEPVLAFAYYGKQGVRVDLKAMYDFNFKNREGAITPFNLTGADYRSGDEFHVDYAVGYDLGKMQVGISGYYYKQVEGDRIDNDFAQAGIDNLGGFKGEVFAIGPSLRVNAGKAQIIASWQHETAARFRPEGDKFWLKAIIPL